MTVTATQIQSHFSGAAAVQDVTKTLSSKDAHLDAPNAHVGIVSPDSTSSHADTINVDDAMHTKSKAGAAEEEEAFEEEEVLAAQLLDGDEDFEEAVSALSSDEDEE
jgi:hypothetical protein